MWLFAPMVRSALCYREDGSSVEGSFLLQHVWLERERHAQDVSLRGVGRDVLRRVGLEVLILLLLEELSWGKGGGGRLAAVLGKGFTRSIQGLNAFEGSRWTHLTPPHSSRTNSR